MSNRTSRRALLAVTSLAVLAATALLPAAPAAARLVGPNPWVFRTPLNLAHRGGSFEAPENTLFAYATALAAGADMIEADVHETADGELVVIHDATVDRTTDGTGSVSSLTLAQLRALDAAHEFVPEQGTQGGRPEADYVFRGVATGARPAPEGATAADFRIPTLAEVLDRFAGVPLVVELKPDPDSTGRYERKLADLLRSRGRADDVYVASFLDHNLALLAAHAPELPTSPGTAGVGEFVAASTAGPGHRLDHDVLAVPVAAGPVPIVTQDLVDDAHRNDLAVHVFTLNSCAEMLDVLRLGVDAIYTDRPRVLQALLDQPPSLRTCGPPPPTDAEPGFRFLQANIGNVNLAGCSDQVVKLCLAPVEDRVRAAITRLAPEVVALQEVLPASLCRPAVGTGYGTPAGSPSLANPSNLCNPAGGRSTTEQLDRLLPPDRWETRCNAPDVDVNATPRVIPPWDCIGVRRDVGAVRSSTSFPGAVGCDNGFTANLATLVVGRRLVDVTSAHPDSTSAPCRVAKLTPVLDRLEADGRSAIVAGDMNLDPYRVADVSTALWNARVSAPDAEGRPTGGRRFVARSGAGEDGVDPPFTSNICGLSMEDPTGLVTDVTQPEIRGCASTIDHVATTPDLVGTCTTLDGTAPGRLRIDGDGGLDHKGIVCDLRFTEASSLDPAQAPAPVVPELPLPAAAVLVGAGASAAVLVRRRRRR